MKNLIYIALTSTLLFSCGNTKETTPENTTTDEQVSEVCTINYAGKSTVNWTAFKLSEKVGVNGTFDSVVVNNTIAAETAEAMLTGAQFEIYTSTVNSNDSVRDWKLSNQFFNVMNAPEKLTGSVIKLENGTGEVALTMNGVTINTPVSYSVKDDAELMLETTINVPDWEAQVALDSLNHVCSEKHTGEDGVNKLWPDVDVKVFIEFSKECK